MERVCVFGVVVFLWAGGMNGNEVLIPTLASIILLRKIILNCDDMLRDVDDNSKIFLHQADVLIVDSIRNAVRTLYVLEARVFLEKRVAEGKWVRTQLTKRKGL